MGVPTDYVHVFVGWGRKQEHLAAVSGQLACGTGDLGVQRRGLEKTPWKRHEIWEEVRRKMVGQRDDEQSGDPSTSYGKWDQVGYGDDWRGERGGTYPGVE